MNGDWHARVIRGALMLPLITNVFHEKKQEDGISSLEEMIRLSEDARLERRVQAD